MSYLHASVPQTLISACGHCQSGEAQHIDCVLSLPQSFSVVQLPHAFVGALCTQYPAPAGLHCGSFDAQQYVRPLSEFPQSFSVEQLAHAFDGAVFVHEPEPVGVGAGGVGIGTAWFGMCAHVVFSSRSALRQERSVWPFGTAITPSRVKNPTPFRLLPNCFCTS